MVHGASTYLLDLGSLGNAFKFYAI